MIRYLFKFKVLLSLIIFGLFLQSLPAFATSSKLLILGTGNETRPDTKVNKENAVSDRIVSEPIETIVVTLKDEQVQRLIEALTSQPQQAATIKPEEKVGGLASLIKKIRYLSNIIQRRIDVLKSDMGADPEDLPHLYQLLSKGESQEKPDPFKTLMSVIGLLGASLVIL
jgi:hypothetical protein